MNNRREDGHSLKIDPRIVQAGWYAFGASVFLWIAGMLVSPTSGPSGSGSLPMLRVQAAYVVATLQIISAIFAMMIVAPYRRSRRRRRPMRDWSLRIFLLVIVMTGLLQISLLMRITHAQ